MIREEPHFESAEEHNAYHDASATELVLRRVDWTDLAEQKGEGLIRAIEDCRRRGEQVGYPYDMMATHLEGLLHFIDAIQDAAFQDGHPVVFLEEEDE